MEIAKKLEQGYDALRVDAPTPGNVIYYQDPLVPYLRLKVSAFSRTWVFDIGLKGRHIKRQIGDASAIPRSEACMTAYEWRKKLAAGEIPPTVDARARDLAKQLVTVESLFLRYHSEHVEEHAASSAAWMKRAFELYWGPIKGLYVSELSPTVLRKWLLDVREQVSGATSNRQRTNLQACLRWGAAQGISAFSPELFMAVKAFPEEERVVYLKQGYETERIRAALLKQSRDIQDIIWMLLITGQRKSNVLSMEWNEIDFENAVWNIPKHKSKTKRAYHVPLTAMALDIIRRRKGNHAKWVFPSCRQCSSGHISSINKAWGEVRNLAGLPSLRIHDLRHSVATWLAKEGASAFEIQRALNHASVTTSQKYVHLFADDVRQKLEVIQEALG